MSLDCIQKAKFESFVEATNQELMGEIFQEMKEKPKQEPAEEKKVDNMKILLQKIEDAKNSGVQGPIADGMSKEEWNEKQELDEIEDLVSLANGEE